ncbi:MAG: transcriptional regulator, partial [Lachnospiraceae bacterium]|nr:transcriptional regulator [Lachnospiraceae bacterium]
GKVYDWNSANHRELIDYWKSIIREEPKNVRAYFYLLDDLIDDKRLKEAREVLEEAAARSEDSLYEAYAIWIDETEQGFESVKDRYRALADKYSGDWRVLFNVANAFSTWEYYEDAIEYWQKTFDAMTVPRYTDPFDAIYQCRLKLGDKKGAAAALKAQKKLLKDDWGVTYGSEVDELDRKINELEGK